MDHEIGPDSTNYDRQYNNCLSVLHAPDDGLTEECNDFASEFACAGIVMQRVHAD